MGTAHSVQWSETFEFQCSFSTDASMMLQPLRIQFNVRQETKGGRGSTKVGRVTLNLAEFASGGAAAQGQHYLLADSKDNSSLELSVALLQVAGPPTFKMPSSEKSGASVA